MKISLECNSLAELPGVSEELIKKGKNYKVWLFKGEMGAGKTTLIQTLVNQMGTTDQVSSPSYSLVNEYFTDAGARIYHFDFFRLNSIEEALDIGIDEYLESNDYCFIEWPEIIEPLLPEIFLEIHIENTEKEKRILNLYTYG